MPATVTSVRVRSKETFQTSFNEVSLGMYATGGVSVTPAQLGLERIDHYVIWLKSVETTTTAQSDQYTYDTTTQKILSYGADNSETTDATDLSGITLNVLAFMFI